MEVNASLEMKEGVKDDGRVCKCLRQRAGYCQSSYGEAVAGPCRNGATPGGGAYCPIEAPVDAHCRRLLKIVFEPRFLSSHLHTARGENTE